MNTHDDEILLDSLLSKLEQILNCKDDSSSDDSSFLSWLNPGLPYLPEEFNFIGQPTASNENLDGAEAFANLVNSIPTSCQGVFVPSSANLARIYEKVLELSKIPNDELTEEEQNKVEKLRSKLYVTVKKKNIITDEETEVLEPSPLVTEYSNYMEAYNLALLTYNNKRISAINNGGAAMQDFALNGAIYKSSVKHAMDNWIARGYKNDYETLTSYLDQMLSKSASRQKSNLKNILNTSMLTAATSGYKFPYTQFFPADFMSSDNGWVDVAFSSKEADNMEKTSSSTTTASVGFRKGLFDGSADASYSQNEHHIAMESADFSMKFKVSQVFISRPWFSVDFLLSKNWDWSENPLSDGGANPSGQMPGFPTAAVFVKDVEIQSQHIKETFDEVEKKLSVGVSVGWGPFRFGGKHDSSSKETHTTYDEKTGTLKISGMQLVAFKCFKMPKAPDCKIDQSKLF